MNRRQKIIVSVTGIFIVLLALVGLTYAYFLTRIQGNTSDKSISVTTANLSLIYGDGNQLITGDKIMPGTTLKEKTFTVTNNGNSTTDYAVIIEDVNVYYSETIVVDGVTQTAGEKTTFESNDFVYTLLCTMGEGEAEEECNGTPVEITFPITGGVIVGNRIEVGQTQNYTLTVKYKETGLNQSGDMNKALQAKINIIDLASLNPYSNDKTLLAYNIINNAISITQEQKDAGYAELLSTPITKVGTENGEYISTRGYEYPERTMAVRPSYQEKYWTYAADYTVNQNDGTFNLVNPKTCKYDDGTCHEMLIGKYIISDSPAYATGTTDDIKNTSNLYNIYKITNTQEPSTSTIKLEYKKVGKMVESTLSATQDDYGTSYYYRGAVKNNFLTFNNMCWRIVRIEGDGSIKIVLSDATAECSTDILTKTDSAFIGTGDYGYIESENGEYIADYENSVGRTTSMKYKFEEWLNGTLEDGTQRFSEENKAKLKETKVCLKDNIKKWNIQTLVCTGEKTSEIKMYPLTLEEIIFAGGLLDSFNMGYYLYANTDGNDSTDVWWTISNSINSAATVRKWTSLIRKGFYLNSENYLRPAVSLVSGTKIASGDGSIESPYTIN